MIGIVLATLGVVGITLILLWIFYSVFRLKMVYIASDLSREIQGIATLPKPALKNLVNLAKFLKSRRDEIVEPMKEDEEDDKYRNTYG